MRWCVLVILAAALVTAAYHLRYYPRATLLLLQLEDNGHPGRLERLGAQAVTQKTCSIPSKDGAIPCRLYLPAHSESASALVLVHGIHWRGMDEPRLMRFARDFAERGVVVLTPEIASLKDYRVETAAITEIGEAAHFLREQRGRPVAVMGLSFAGGLALMAAADPRFAPDIKLVISVGGYDDLPRVSRFLVSGRAELPDGSVQTRPVEQYGALVLVYDNIEDFIAARDDAAARRALSLWLEEKYSEARVPEKSLTVAGRGRLEALFHFQLASLQPELLAEIQKRSAEMESVSPAGKLADLRVPVFLLHGDDDGVIPPSETLWLERDIPATDLRRALITPAMAHVEPNAKARWRGRWQLVKFMAAVFAEIERRH